jgi:hypothetical protein
MKCACGLTDGMESRKGGDRWDYGVKTTMARQMKRRTADEEWKSA